MRLSSGYRKSYSEDEGSSFLRNICDLLLGYVASNPRKHRP
jgi:hypothetical protein